MTGQPDLADLGAAELLARFAAGTAMPSEAIEACIARMESCEPVVAAIRTRCDASARLAASQADARWRAGRPRPLEGVPFLVKDTIDTAGVLTTLGSAPAVHRLPERSATVVKRLVDAGAILAGKTAVPEFAFGDAREDHRATNPWDRSCWTGGSSAGSAAALAAREAPIALGTDTGGSIRVPASYCGVSGIKPTLGRIPRDGIEPVSWTLDQAGPMARSALDLAQMLAIMADRFRHSRVGAVTELSGLRVGIPAGWFLDDCDPGVLRVFEEAVGLVSALGAIRSTVVIEHAALAAIIAWTITVAEFASLQDDDPERLDALTPATVERIAAGRALGAADYLRALRGRHLLQRELGTVFESVDVILTPATPTPAPRFGAELDAIFAMGDGAWLERIARNLLMANVTGIPALVVPAGFSDDRPVGLQILAGPFRDAECLRVGEAFQNATAHHRAMPPH